LLSLGKDEERKGEAGRSALVYVVLAERFADDDEALTYERKAVDSLLRAGREDQAYARILRLEEKYGPGTEWASSRPPPVREKAREEMVAMLKLISERKFEEGVRTGESGAMAAAKTGMERFFSVKEETRTGEDAELRLKLAIASLKAGDRDTGVAILKGLSERGESPVGERAAILYAETRIAAYERKEDTAEGAQESAQLLLARYPSEKAAGLAYRAAAAFLSNEQYDRAKQMAEEIEKHKETPKPVLDDARLVYAEAAVFTNDHTTAREKAELVFESPSEEVKPEVRERARNLFVLASLKEIESRTGEQDWRGAGRMLEELGRRFPGDPEAPDYFLRAFRSYRTGGDMEAATKVGMLFLDDFPHRKEGVEIAGAVGATLVEGGEPGKAADLYASVAERLPKSPEAPDLLFLAARLSVENGDPGNAAKRFSSYRAKYANPRWKSAYSTISIGLLAWERGDVKTAVRELEEGIRRMDAGVEKDAPRELFEIGGRGIIVLGEHWAEQFRKVTLVDPLEKSLAMKERFFRRALAVFEKAKEESPTEVAIQASQMSGDLFVDFGKSILDAQRPKGLKGEQRERFEEALSERARGFFEKALDWYVGALDRLEAEKGPADLAVPIRERIESALVLLSGTTVVRGVR
jgi:tetratricopeptide (TPR) repeat protein